MFNRTLSITILIIISTALYLPTLQYDFVFDDEPLIIQNLWIKDIKHLPDIFFSSSWEFFEDMKVNTYRPMQHVILMLEYYLFGLKPWGYHLVNIFLHAVNTLLAFFLASFIFKTQQMTSIILSEAKNDKKSCLTTAPAFFAALLFAAHPINTQAVAWITTVVELSMASLYLLSFYFYAISSPGWNSRLAFSVIFFALAVFLKEQAITLLFLILLYDYSKKGSALSFIKGYRKYIPYLFVVIGYMALRVYALGGFTAQEKPIMGFGQLILNAFPLFAQYVKKLILPVDLKLLYVFHPVQTLIEWKVMGAMAFTFLFVLLWYFVKTRDRVVFTGLTFIAIPLLPVYYMPAIREIVFSEHYLYLSTFGFALLISYVFMKIHGGLKNKGFDSKITGRILLSISLLVLMVYSIATTKRHVVWKNNFSLWLDTVEKSPDSIPALGNLGIAYGKRGLWDQAAAEFKKSIKIDPNYAKSHFNLGDAYSDRNLWDKAIIKYKEAIKINPNYSRAHFKLGNAYFAKGLVDQAIIEYKKTIEIRPDFANAYNNLGSMYAKKWLFDNAILEYKKALKTKPDFKEAENNLKRAKRGRAATKKRAPQRH